MILLPAPIFFTHCICLLFFNWFYSRRGDLESLRSEGIGILIVWTSYIFAISRASSHILKYKKLCLCYTDRNHSGICLHGDLLILGSCTWTRPLQPRLYANIQQTLLYHIQSMNETPCKAVLSKGQKDGCELNKCHSRRKPMFRKFHQGYKTSSEISRLQIR